MIDEYSIELNAAQIFDARTREYFSEVSSSYSAGNYRSAVVMLWAVTVCDLLFKLQNLVELHDDIPAKEILAEIAGLQNDNQRSPAWESKLIELIGEKTQLLDNPEKDNLEHLKRQRHLAAHPIVNTELELHRPNRDTVRALIRNTLSGVLTKAPILSQRIVKKLLIDLEEVSSIFIDRNQLHQFLVNKYFSRFNSQVEKAVFRSLWKIVFKLNDKNCEKNREINYDAVLLLYQQNKQQFISQIATDNDYFSAIALNGTALIYLTIFLSRNPEIYAGLASPAQVVIRNFAKTQPITRVLAWYTTSTLSAHAEELNAWVIGPDCQEIGIEVWDLVLNNVDESLEWVKVMIDLANRYYTVSKNYNEADQRFGACIRPQIDKYQVADCVDLIQRIESNNQTYHRGRARGDHWEVVTRLYNLDPQFDYSNFLVFKESFSAWDQDFQALKN
jgi:hypothetical protein